MRVVVPAARYIRIVDGRSPSVGVEGREETIMHALTVEYNHFPGLTF